VKKGTTPGVESIPGVVPFFLIFGRSTTYTMKFNQPSGLATLGILLILFFISCSTAKDEWNNDGEDWSFIVFGDVQQGYGVFSKLAAYIGQQVPEPDAAFSCGDIMLRPANEVEWVNFWRYSDPITDKMPLYIARGNHEGNDSASELVLHEYGKIPGNRFYRAVHVRNSYVIILDTQIRGEEASISGEQFQWFQHELDSVSGQPDILNVFIVMHHPVFPQGRYKGSNLKNADEVHALIRDHQKVKAVFAGHDHIFNRYIKDGVNYITTGGGGAPLYHGYGGDFFHFIKVSFYEKDQRINIKTIGLFKEIVEDFDL
jgi:hypothetical protein